eukprot:1333817-Alexandrium_andersonii.AAC.1
MFTNVTACRKTLFGSMGGVQAGWPGRRSKQSSSGSSNNKSLRLSLPRIWSRAVEYWPPCSRRAQFHTSGPKSNPDLDTTVPTFSSSARK